MGTLDNRVAIVTGAGMGVGRGIAGALAREGAHVVVAEIDTAAGADTARWLTETWGVRALSVPTDVSDQQQVEAMVDAAVAEYGRLDILVNNAWRGLPYARLEQTPPENMSAGFDTAVMAAFWGMQRAYPALAERGTGRVINLASLNGVNAHMYSVAYNAAKEALRAVTRTAAREWAPKQVCCNVVCPGARSAAYQRMAEADPEMAASMEAANPMGRLGDPLDDIGPVVAFLAGDGARYLTGNTMFVDGGAHINGVQWAPEVD